MAGATVGGGAGSKKAGGRREELAVLLCAFATAVRKRTIPNRKRVFRIA